jgi:tripartite-type tricarboxylate transporter receptor subunit TctC
LVAEQPMVLVARKDLPVANLKEFIAYVKANHAKMQFGSAGIGSTTHLSCALVNAAMGEHPVHVPFRGGGPAMAEVVAGRMDYGCFNIGGVAGADQGRQPEGHRHTVAPARRDPARPAKRARAGP